MTCRVTWSYPDDIPRSIDINTTGTKDGLDASLSPVIIDLVCKRGEVSEGTYGLIYNVIW
jgi:hypothetical protein